MNTTVEPGDRVVLIDASFRKFIVDTAGKTDKVRGVGVFDPKILVGIEYGNQIKLGNKIYWVLIPSLQDKLQGLKRKAQIILPRDAAQILMFCSIESGQTVLEAGIGSGSLTIALATAVAPKGKVISYDLRQDFIDHAMENLKNSGLDHLITPRIKDVTMGIEEENLDAVILDIPNPWEAVGHAWNALKPGGYICSFSPLISQVENTVKVLQQQHVIEVKTVENIQREMIVSERGTRPSFDMLGHTGYLTFARKVLTPACKDE